jgi:hypothetical protein
VWTSKALLIVHAVTAGVLVGSSTHLGLQSLALVRGAVRARLLRLYPPVALAAWAVTFAVGAVMYPHYRIDVRDRYLDDHAVWASVLFDVKENLAVFVGPLLAAAWWMAPAVIEDTEPARRRWFMAVCLVAGGISWWNLLSGLLVSSVRSV